MCMKVLATNASDTKWAYISLKCLNLPNLTSIKNYLNLFKLDHSFLILLVLKNVLDPIKLAKF